MINIVMDSQILTTLQTCPRLYNFRFNQNLVPAGGKSNSLEIGSLAHTILEWYYKALVNGAARKESIEIGMAAGHEYIRGYSPENKYVTDPNEKGMTTGPESDIIS